MQKFFRNQCDLENKNVIKIISKKISKFKNRYQLIAGLSQKIN